MKENIDCPECGERIANNVEMPEGAGLTVISVDCPHCGYCDLPPEELEE